MVDCIAALVVCAAGFGARRLHAADMHGSHVTGKTVWDSPCPVDTSNQGLALGVMWVLLLIDVDSCVLVIGFGSFRCLSYVLSGAAHHQWP